MTISKPHLTLVTNLALATVGSTIAYLTNWIIIIPILFGLGIPLVNIDKPLKYKAGLTLVIVIASLAVFVIAIMTAVSFNFDKYIFPGLVVGISGVLLLGINGFLIESVKVNTKTVLVTFLLSGLSLPTWIILTESILPTTIRDNDVVRQFGVMLFWMTLTTIGITIGIENKKPTANKVHNQWRGSV